MLFRAYVSTGFPTPLSEAAVFFEAPCTSDAPARLQQLVALAWGCAPSAVDYYNLFSEGELRHPDLARCHCYERGADADTALFINGHGPEGDSYTPLSRTMLMVSPRWHARLLAAQDLVEQRLAARAVDAECARIAKAAGARQAVAA